MNPYNVLPRMSRHVVEQANAPLDAFDQAIGVFTYKVLEGADRGVRRIAHRLRQRRARRNTLKALRGLDDRTLRDIGLHRSEIGSVVEDLTNSWASTSAPRNTIAERRLRVNAELQA